MTQPATAQEIFDFVARHLFTQGGPAAANEVGSCAYRGEGGRTCAVGCRIPDEEYQESMEGWDVFDISTRFPWIRGGEIKANKDLYGDLQGAHDTPYNWMDEDAMRGALREVAVNHNLSPAILDALHFPEART